MEIDRIHHQIVLGFQGDPGDDNHAWHGPSVVETLRGITAEQSGNRLPGSHSIVELVLHMAVWRTFVAARLAGDNSFEIVESTNFPSSQNWEDALRSLHKSQSDLLAALKSFPEEKLTETVPTRSYDFYTLLHGIVQP
jgi:hypothetical protein